MLETWFSPPSVFGPSQILPSKPTSLSRDSSHGPLPGFQRTHPDQDIFCIGPSSRMRMTPAEPFSPSKRVNQSVTTYHSCSCADGDVGGASRFASPRTSYTQGCALPSSSMQGTLVSSLAARRLPTQQTLLPRWPDFRHANGEVTRRHAARRSSKQPAQGPETCAILFTDFRWF